MNKETLENNLKNMISLDFDNSGKRHKPSYLELKEHKTYSTKAISLSSLNINNINDLADKTTAPIYYLFSCLEDYFRCNKNLQIILKDISFCPVCIPTDHIDFFAKIHFWNKFNETGGEHSIFLDSDCKFNIEIKFGISDLLYEEKTIYTIETSIKEELERNYNRINFNEDVFRIDAGNIIDHNLNIGRYVIDKHYADIREKVPSYEKIYI